MIREGRTYGFVIKLAESMEDLWKANNKEFFPLAKRLSELAFKLREVQGEQSTDLSPFIYTLY